MKFLINLSSDNNLLGFSGGPVLHKSKAMLLGGSKSFM